MQIHWIVGPAEQVGPNTFKVALDRQYSPHEARSQEVWFYASNPGDAHYKSAVQQALLRLPLFTAGAAQAIDFPAIADQKLGAKSVALSAKSSAGAAVGYYVREGPAYVRDGVLYFTALPPRAKLPVKVTVVAWQFGRGTAPKLAAAEPVARTLLLGP